eukprot:s1176_g7.t1
MTDEGWYSSCCGAVRTTLFVLERKKLPSPSDMEAIPFDTVMQMPPQEIFRILDSKEACQNYALAQPVGEPSAVKGDRNSCNWLSSKHTWKQAMQNRALLVEKLLHSFNIDPDCDICTNPAGFAEHLPAKKHFNLLWERLPEGKPVAECAKMLYQEWRLPGDRGMRFNHLHGQVLIYKGQYSGKKAVRFTAGNGPALSNGGFHAAEAQTPSSYTPSFRAGPPSVSGMSVASQPASVAGPPPTVQDMPAPRPSPYVQPLSADFSKLPQEGVWHVLEEPCSHATNPNGDYRAYAHLNSKHAFKAAMTPRAKIIEDMLGAIQPQCKFCDRHRGYSEHLGAEKHWRALYDGKYTAEGVVIAGVRPLAWNKWRVTGGFVRINELDGTIEISRGSRDPDLDSPAEPAPAQATPDPWANYSGLPHPHSQSMQPPPSQMQQQVPQPAQPAGFPAQAPPAQPPLDSWAHSSGVPQQPCQQPQPLYPPQPSQMQQQQAPQPAQPPAAYPPAQLPLNPNSAVSGVHQNCQQPQLLHPTQSAQPAAFAAEPPSAQPTLDPYANSAGAHYRQPQSLQPQQPMQMQPAPPQSSQVPQRRWQHLQASQPHPSAPAQQPPAAFPVPQAAALPLREDMLQGGTVPRDPDSESLVAHQGWRISVLEKLE